MKKKKKIEFQAMTYQEKMNHLSKTKCNLKRGSTKELSPELREFTDSFLYDSF